MYSFLLIFLKPNFGTRLCKGIWPIKVTANKFSATAKAAIEAAGGEAVTV